MITYLTQNDIIADLHTHTIFSLHAYSTAKENLDAAAARGIKYVAFTDHFYCPDDRIEKKNEVIRSMYAADTINHDSVNVITGAEFNLNHVLESVESRKIDKKIHWKLFGFHTWFLDPYETDISEVPGYFEKSIICSNNSVLTEVKPTAFAHIERELYKCKGADEKSMQDCLAAIVDIAAANNIILEINESSILNDEHGGVDRMMFWIKYANDKHCLFSLGSDAHYCGRVGDFPLAIQLINSIGISKHDIINTRDMEDVLKERILGK